MGYQYTAYTPSSEVTKKQKKMNNATDYYNQNYVQKPYEIGTGGYGKPYNTASKRRNNVINNSTLSQEFEYDNPQLYNKVMNDVVNREAFSYNLDDDMLFQQAKNQFQALGKTAMMDTIGQASSMTGGYGNSYATTAGAQAYNNYLQQLNSSVGDYYAMALSAYNTESDRLNNAFNTVSADRQNALNEWSSEWDLRNTLEAMYMDEMFNWAQMDMNSYQNQANNASNIANLYTDQYNTASGNDLSKWSTGENLKAEQASQAETKRSNKASESIAKEKATTSTEDEEQDDVIDATPKRTEKTSNLINVIERKYYDRGGQIPTKDVAKKYLKNTLNKVDISDEELAYLADYFSFTADDVMEISL